jgi:nucleotide-binding universal stress UspA family protein
MKFERVLVPVDFSDPSVAATHYARSLIAPGGQLDLLHVIDAHALSIGETWTSPGPSALRDAAHAAADLLGSREQLAKLASEELRRFAERHCERGVAHVTVCFGRPADEVLAACARSTPDLVVIGSHSRGALERLFLGSVAEEVARSESTPTLVVREGAQRCEGRIVAAVDTSAPAMARVVVRAARDLSARVNRPFVVLSVVAPAVFVTYPELAAVLPDLTPAAVAAAGRIQEALLEEVAEGAAASREVAVGAPAQEICKRVTPSDLVVCGSHGRGLLGRVAFGTVSAKVLRQAPCPVLVVRPEKS